MCVCNPPGESLDLAMLHFRTAATARFVSQQVVTSVALVLTTWYWCPSAGILMPIMWTSPLVAHDAPGVMVLPWYLWCLAASVAARALVQPLGRSIGKQTAPLVRRFLARDGGAWIRTLVAQLQAARPGPRSHANSLRPGAERENSARDSSGGNEDGGERVQ